MAEHKFLNHIQQRKTNFAYHGSKVDSFHSILNYGLQQHMGKRDLFGHGIYLSSELDVSIAFSPIGLAWKRSDLGKDMSCVALCEYVEHPDYLKSQTETSSTSKY